MLASEIRMDCRVAIHCQITWVTIRELTVCYRGANPYVYRPSKVH